MVACVSTNEDIYYEPCGVHHIILEFRNAVAMEKDPSQGSGPHPSIVAAFVRLRLCDEKELPALHRSNRDIQSPI